jgi:hypothetical protein
MTLEEQLRDTYERAAELAPVPPGAYDRFLRRRARRGPVGGRRRRAGAGRRAGGGRARGPPGAPGSGAGRADRHHCRAHPQAAPVGVHQGAEGGGRARQAPHRRALGTGSTARRPPGQPTPAAWPAPGR